jgi:uncharacterized repeat protein (TIGR03803 family)
MNWFVKRVWIALCITTAIAASAQTLTTLATLQYRNGTNPEAALTQGRDGNLYGTLTNSGAYGAGVVFKINPTGEVTVLHHFCAEAN